MQPFSRASKTWLLAGALALSTAGGAYAAPILHTRDADHDKPSAQAYGGSGGMSGSGGMNGGNGGTSGSGGTGGGGCGGMGGTGGSGGSGTVPMQ